MPQYDSDRNLLLPADYRQWVLVGTSLGLSYAEGAQGHEMFHAIAVSVLHLVRPDLAARRPRGG
jgi:hypothetical protein